MNHTNSNNENNNQREAALKEGALYKCQQGELQELTIDINTSVRKIYINESIYYQGIELRKAIRKQSNGYSPELNHVFSALIAEKIQDEDAAKIVKKYSIEQYEKIKEEMSK